MPSQVGSEQRIRAQSRSPRGPHSDFERFSRPEGCSYGDFERFSENPCICRLPVGFEAVTSRRQAQTRLRARIAPETHREVFI